MCSQNENVYVVHPAGTATDCDSVSVWVVPYPLSHAFQDPLCAASPVELSMTPELAVHGAAVPVSKPGLPSFCPAAVQPVPPPDGLIVQVNDVEPAAPVVSRAVTETVEVPEVVGVPEMSPDAVLIASPAGR